MWLPSPTSTAAQATGVSAATAANATTLDRECIMATKLIVAVSSLLAFAFCSVCAVGAPPSEFVDGPNLWTYFEPVMLPALLGGPLLALGALVIVPVFVRAAAGSCVAVVFVSAVGVTVAWGLDAEAMGFRPLLLPLATLSIPAQGALSGIRSPRPPRVQQLGVS
jgi:hypothetical protein